VGHAGASTEEPIAASPRSPDRMPETTGTLTTSRVNLVAGSAVFVLLTTAIFWFQFHNVPRSDTTLTWDRLRWGYLLLGLLCLPIETLAAAVRTAVVCRIRPSCTRR
jgi:hypothetical protein